MEKTALQEVIEIVETNAPEFQGVVDLLKQRVSKERRQIEASYKAGQNDPQNKDGSGKYYFMTYIDNH